MCTWAVAPCVCHFMSKVKNRRVRQPPKQPASCWRTEEERSESHHPPWSFLARSRHSKPFSQSSRPPFLPLPLLFFPPILSAGVVCVSPCYFAALLSLDSRLISVQHLCGHKEATHWFLLFFFFFHYPNTEEKQRREGGRERTQKREKRKRWVEGTGGTMSRRERDWRTREDWSHCHRRATFSFEVQSERID